MQQVHISLGRGKRKLETEVLELGGTVDSKLA